MSYPDGSEDLDDEDLDDDGIDYEAGDTFGLELGEVTEFVDAYLVPWVTPRLQAGTGVWCPEWAAHPHVLIRVMELAVSRRLTADDPASAARWWVDVLDRHTDRLTALDGPFRACQAGHNQGVAPPTPPLFDDVAAWFEQWFAVVLTRQTPTDLYWCPGWRDHPEVVLQLTALWAGWEQARATPPAMIAWWDHAHRTLAAVTSPGGPFTACKAARRHVERWTTLTGQPVVASLDEAGRPYTERPAWARPSPR